MWNRQRSATRGLTSSELEISGSRRLVRVLTAMLVLALLALLALAASISLLVLVEPTPAPAVSAVLESPSLSGADEAEVGDAQITLLEGQNVQLGAKVDALQDALNGATLDLEMERATRKELELQINGLREQLAQTQEELAFLKSAAEVTTKP